MTDFMTNDKALTLLAVCGMYIALSLFLRWLKRVDEDMPLPEPEPCANCGSIDAYPRYFRAGEKSWLAYKCDTCPVQMPPVESRGKHYRREDEAKALGVWNDVMRQGPPETTRQK